MNEASCWNRNFCSAKFLETIGAKSIIPVRVIQLQMLFSLRWAINIPIDVQIEKPAFSCEYIKHFEDFEIIRIAVPNLHETGCSAHFQVNS